MQTKIGSLAETLANVVVGIVVSLMLNFIVFPKFGWVITTQQNVILVCIYTAVSIIRSYSMRRLFNYISMRFGF